jgi:anthranilate/para-aminobenzoate synthase component I
VTGAPKKRACEIIDELEGYRRGIYTGAIGILTPEGEMTLSVAIRTLAVAGSRACFGVGGAILGDSDPVEEYRECLVKAAAFLRAFGVDDHSLLTLHP